MTAKTLYWFFNLSAFMAMFFYLYKKRAVLEPVQAILLWLMSGVGLYWGGRVGYALILHPERIVSDTWRVIHPNYAGMNSIGALAGMLLLSGLYAVYLRVPLARWLDCLGPAVLLAVFFARLGCWSAGCCFGKALPTSQGLYPTQLMEAAAAVIVFTAIALLQRRYVIGRQVGDVGVLAIASYLLIHIGVEFWRGDRLEVSYYTRVLPAILLLLVLLSLSLRIFRSR